MATVTSASDITVAQIESGTRKAIYWSVTYIVKHYPVNAYCVSLITINIMFIYLLND